MSSSLTNQIYSTQNYKHILKLWLIFKTALYLCILIFYILWLYPLVSSRWLAVFLLSCVFLSLSSLWKPTPHLMDRWQCQPALAPLLSFPCYPPSLFPHVILLMLSPSWTIVFKPGPLLSNHRWKRPQTTAFSTHPCKKTKPWRCHSHPHIFMKTLQQVCETALTSQYGTLFCLFAFLTVFLLPQLTPFWDGSKYIFLGGDGLEILFGIFISDWNIDLRYSNIWDGSKYKFLGWLW